MGAVDVVSRLRESVLSWQDPVVRHHRALRRARDRVGRRVVVATGLGGATAVLLPYSGIGLPDVGWTAAAAAAAASVVLAVRRLHELERQVPSLPAPRYASAARPLVDRLGRAAGTLTMLLARLAPPAGSSLTLTAGEAAGAERSLRELAVRVEAVESALAIAPSEAHVGLMDARRLLLTRLEEGALAYECLVAAAAECVAAAALGPGDGFARRRLDEATEGLRGLAAGLSEAHAVGRTVGV